MSKTKRAISLFLAIFAFLLFCCSGTLVQSARAIVGVDDAVIAIIIAALAAMGITFVSYGAYGNLKDYVGSLLEEYAEDHNTTVYQMFRGAQSGTNKLGQVILNNRFVQIIDVFALWLVSKFSLQDNSTVNVVSANGSIGSMIAYTLPFSFVRSNGLEYKIELYRGNNVYVVLSYNQNNPSIITPVCVANNSAYVQRILIRADGTIVTEDPLELQYESNYGKYLLWSGLGTYNTAYYPDLVYTYKYEFSELQQAMINDLQNGSAPIDIVTGAINPPSEDQDYTPGDGAVIDVGAEWGMSYEDVTEDVIPGEFSGVQEGEAEIEYVDEQEAAEQVEDTPSQSVSSEATDYQVVGLQNVFPFCIPFDIYSFFECLAADPVAPVVNWRFYIPDICDETITIDLSQFNTVAQIVRTMELLAFIVGLALVTREKFLRG